MGYSQSSKRGVYHKCTHLKTGKLSDKQSNKYNPRIRKIRSPNYKEAGKLQQSENK